MVQGPEVSFLVEIAASEDSFEGEDCLNMFGLAFLESGVNLNGL